MTSPGLASISDVRAGPEPRRPGRPGALAGGLAGAAGWAGRSGLDRHPGRGDHPAAGGRGRLGGAWLYGRVRHTVQLRRYRREQAAAARPAGAPPTGAIAAGAPPTVAVPAGAVPAGAVPAAGVPAAGLAAAALAAAGPVGCAAVLVARDSDCPGGMRAVHSGAGRSGRPSLADTRDTRFEIGSVTKVFTGLILADMVVCGETGLDATLGHTPGRPRLDAGYDPSRHPGLA